MSSARRHVFLINRRFQFRMAFYVCSWVVALCFIYPWIIYNLFDYFIRYAEMDPMGPNLVGLYQTRKEVLLLLLISQGTFLGLTFIISLFLGHRIAGPLYKLRLTFAKARDGDLGGELHFRKFDHFKEVAEDYNTMISAIRSRIDKASAQVEKSMQNEQLRNHPDLKGALELLRGSSAPSSTKE